MFIIQILFLCKKVHRGRSLSLELWDILGGGRGPLAPPSGAGGRAKPPPPPHLHEKTQGGGVQSGGGLRPAKLPQSVEKEGGWGAGEAPAPPPPSLCPPPLQLSLGAPPLYTISYFPCCIIFDTEQCIGSKKTSG